MNTSSKNTHASSVLTPVTTNELTSGSVAVIGAPIATKEEHRQSTALGPNAIRRSIEEVFGIFINSSDRLIEDLDTGKKRSLNPEFCMHDLGDLSSDLEKKTIIELFSFLSEKNVIPVMLGGDRRIGSWCSEALSELNQDCAIVHITPTISEKDSQVDIATFFLGLNGLIPAKLWQQADDHKHTCVTAEQIYEVDAIGASEHLLGFLKEQKRVFWHIDVSVVDTGHASGTPNINVGGVDPEQILEILDLISFHASFAGCAITNVAPVYDKRGLSEYFAAESLSRVIAPMLWHQDAP